MAWKEYEDFDNPYNPLQGKMDKIIDYFSDFLGEQYREVITERLNDCLFIFCDNSSVRSDGIVRAFNNNINDEMKSFTDSWVKRTKYHKTKNFNVPNSAIYKQFNYIDKFKNGIYLDGQNDRDSYVFASNFLGLTPARLVEILSNKKQTEKLNNIVSGMFDVYDSEFRDKIKEKVEIKERLTYLPWKDQTDEIEGEFYESWKKKFKSEISSKVNLPITKTNEKYLDDIVELYFSYGNLEISMPIFKLFFMQDLFEITNADDKTLETLFSEIHGILLDNFGEFENDKIKKDEKIYDLKNGVQNVINELSNYVEGEELDIKSQDVYKDIAFGANGICSTSYDFEKKQQFVYCRTNSVIYMTDSVIVHEMLHAVQTNIFFDEKVSKMGIRSSLNYKLYLNRDITPLNEVINEYFTCKIAERMKNDGFLINDDKYKEAIYYTLFPMFGDFIEENLQDIITCCMSDDKDLIFKMFGKENIFKINNFIKKMFKFEKSGELYCAKFEIEYRGHENDDIRTLAYTKSKEWSETGRNYFKLVREGRKIAKEVQEYKNNLLNSELSDDEIEI